MTSLSDQTIKDVGNNWLNKRNRDNKLGYSRQQIDNVLQDPKLLAVLKPTITQLVNELKIEDTDPYEIWKKIYYTKTFKNKESIKFGNSKYRKPKDVISNVINKTLIKWSEAAGGKPNLGRKKVNKDENLINILFKGQKPQLDAPLMSEGDKPPKEFLEGLDIEKLKKQVFGKKEVPLDKTTFTPEKQTEQALTEKLKSLTEKEASKPMPVHAVSLSERKQYNFTGPGTKLTEKFEGVDGVPINVVDYYAAIHDFQYISENPNVRRIADIRFIKDIQKYKGKRLLLDADITVAKTVIGTKMKFEDVVSGKIKESDINDFSGPPRSSKTTREMTARAISAFVNSLAARGYHLSDETGKMEKSDAKPNAEDYLKYAKLSYTQMVNMSEQDEKGDTPDAPPEFLLNQNPALKSGHFDMYGHNFDGVANIQGTDSWDMIQGGGDPVEPVEPIDESVEPVEPAEPEVEFTQDTTTGTTTTSATPEGITEKPMELTIPLINAPKSNIDPKMAAASSIEGEIRGSMKLAGSEDFKLTEKQDQINEDRIMTEIVLKGTDYDYKDNKLKIEDERNYAIRMYKANELAATNDAVINPFLNQQLFVPESNLKAKRYIQRRKKSIAVRRSYKQGNKRDSITSNTTFTRRYPSSGLFGVVGVNPNGESLTQADTSRTPFRLSMPTSGTGGFNTVYATA